MTNENRSGTERCAESSRNVAGKQAEPVALDEFNAASYEEWEAAAGAALAAKGAEPVKGPAFEKRMFTQTYEGITLHPVYTASDTKELRGARTYPGLYALRGNTASGHIGRPWAIAQFIDSSDPAAANRDMKHELERGATAVAFAVNEGIGEGEAETLLKGLLNKSLHIEAGPSALPLLKIIETIARKDGLMPRALMGCVGADPLAAWLQLPYLLWVSFAAYLNYANIR